MIGNGEQFYCLSLSTQPNNPIGMSLLNNGGEPPGSSFTVSVFEWGGLQICWELYVEGFGEKNHNLLMYDQWN